MKRGEVWEADLPAPVGRRPVLILSRDSMPVRRPEITVAYLTTKVRNSPVEVPLTTADDGVQQDCVCNLDSVNTIPKKSLLHRVCILSAARMGEVASAIQFALELT